MPSPHTLHFNQTCLADATALIQRYETRELASAFRSTVPLLALIKDVPDTLEQIFEAIGINAPCDLHCEFQVLCSRGRGKPSHTDLMIKSGASSWAIEAKWTEPRYATVAEWMDEADAASANSRWNRQEVLSGWLDLIRERVPTTPEAASMQSHVYQMIHRAASACATSENPTLVYLVFHEGRELSPEKAFYEADLRLLHDALGRPANFPFFLITVPMDLLSAFEDLANLKKGDVRTGDAVRTALLADALFEFGMPRTIHIN